MTGDNDVERQWSEQDGGAEGGAEADFSSTASSVTSSSRAVINDEMLLMQLLDLPQRGRWMAPDARRNTDVLLYYSFQLIECWNRFLRGKRKRRKICRLYLRMKCWSVFSSRWQK